MKVYKYQGAGNDFVIIDNRDAKFDLSTEEVKLLCDRRFGVGGDGMMLLGRSEKYDFKMSYYNSDGKEGTMCGNGGRCLVAFAAHRGIEKFDFEAIDGFHTAQVLEYSSTRCIVRLKMIDVEKVKVKKLSDSSYFLFTGSDHFVMFVDGLDKYDVDTEGKYWRHHPQFPKGTNVNFVEIGDGEIAVRTYERGVEAETYACGTGVTASSIATWIYQRENNMKTVASAKDDSISFDIQALGDSLAVDFKENDHKFEDVYLTGPATFVFETEWNPIRK